MKIPIKVTIKVTKEFEKKIKKSLKKSISYTKDIIKKEIHSDSGNTANKLDYNINFTKGEARIGWKSNSHEQLVGNVLQYGSGERGRSGGTYVLTGESGGAYKTSKFGESKPDYTVPILPTHSTSMKFKGANGKIKHMKIFKGHIPRYVITKGATKAMKFFPAIFYNEWNK